MEKVLQVLNKFIHFLYALFFTRDDDLDVLQILFAAIVVVSLFAVWHISVGSSDNDAVKIEALVTLRWLAGLLVVTAVPKWLVPMVVKNKSNVTEPEIAEE